MRTLGALSAIAVAAFFLPAHAALITPGGFENTAGNDSNCMPFTCSRGSRYQQVYDASAFGGATGVVGSVAFRLDNRDIIPNGPFPPIINPSFNLTLDLLVSLSHTAVNSQTISTNLAGNVGGDATVVFDGVLNWSTTQLPGDDLNPFDLLIDFDNIFAFNGTQNLLLDITVRNRDTIATQLDGRTPYIDAAFGFPAPNQAPFGRAWGDGSAGAGWNTKYGLISQFDLVKVPEPSTFVLFVAALLALVAVRRRRVFT
jgi:hypothetical protein